MRSATLSRQPLLTPHEASTYLGVPTSTLAVWRSTGRVQLPYVKVGGHVRYRHDDIEVFLTGQYHAGGTESVSKVAAVGPKVTTFVRRSNPLRTAYFERVGKFVCEGCFRVLRDSEAHIATCLDAPISDPHDAHCFCANCHRELMKLTSPMPASPGAPCVPQAVANDMPRRRSGQLR